MLGVAVLEGLTEFFPSCTFSSLNGQRFYNCGANTWRESPEVKMARVWFFAGLVKKIDNGEVAERLKFGQFGSGGDQARKRITA